MGELLIKNCICGRNEFLSFKTFFGNGSQLFINECLRCGVKHQIVNMEYEEYMERYSSEYSFHEGKDGGQLISKERYFHDYEIAKIREEKYQTFIKKGSVILDVGSGNGAFVDYMNLAGYEARGLEICEEYNNRKVTYAGDFNAVKLKSRSFDAITMHDILEHFVNPVTALNFANYILRKKGILIIDFPDFFSKNGLHHWKLIEHLWLLKRKELSWILELTGFDVIEIYKPIPSKFVVCAMKKQA